MKILYCDCFSGISGDMFLGALIDAGVDEKVLQQELSKLGLEAEYNMKIDKTVKRGISATDVNIELIKHAHDNEEPHHHHRNLIDIARVVDSSELCPEIKSRIKYVFQRLGLAEAKVHGTTIDKIHFHEVGAVDAIIDIAGVVIGLSLLGVDKVISSPLPTGSGFVECAHGIIPVPAPATAELLKNIPIYDPGIVGEMVTPTGAALISSLADDFSTLPLISITNIGYGAGNKDFGLPNVLRVFIGETQDNPENLRENDVVYVLETNIDDISPEILGYLWEKMLDAGVLDMYYTPIYMKKGRLATLLTIIIKKDDLSKISNMLFNETSTIGLRITEKTRICLKRETIKFDTPLGKIQFKISGNTIKPEFEDVKQLALINNMPLKEAYRYVMAEYLHPKTK